MFSKKTLVLALLLTFVLPTAFFAHALLWSEESENRTHTLQSLKAGDYEKNSSSLAQNEGDFHFAQAPEQFVIEGLVENPLNLTYVELRNFPLLSEVTPLQCVGSGEPPYGPSVVYNWTGVPLFYLLNMANVTPGAYREVVFNATDGFSSSVLLETAMHPTTILALEANGTDLEQISGLGSGYRVVLPCRWGYKWVRSVKQIIIVDYDYKGTYELYGFSDEAIRPNCTMPTTNPSIQSYDIGKYSIQVLSTSPIESFSSVPQQKFAFTLGQSEENSGYFYITFPLELLQGPYEVKADGIPIRFLQTDVNGDIYLSFKYDGNVRKIEIIRLLDPGEYGGIGRREPPLHT